MYLLTSREVGNTVTRQVGDAISACFMCLLTSKEVGNFAGSGRGGRVVGGLHVPADLERG